MPPNVGYQTSLDKTHYLLLNDSVRSLSKGWDLRTSHYRFYLPILLNKPMIPDGRAGVDLPDLVASLTLLAIVLPVRERYRADLRGAP